MALHQAVHPSDRSRSIVYLQNRKGEIQIVKKPVLLKGFATRRTEALISYHGRTYRYSRSDGDRPVAVLVNGSTGLAENWLILKQQGQLLSDDFPTFKFLGRDEMTHQFRRRLAALRPQIGGKPVPFAQLVRPSQIHIESTETAVDYQPDFHLRDSSPLSLRKSHLTLEFPDTTKKFRMELLRPPGGGVFSPEQMTGSLKRLPRNAIGGLRRIVVMPRERKLVLNDGDPVAAYYDYMKGDMVVQDGITEDLDSLMVHEIVGHGMESDSPLIEQLIVHAMKLDRAFLSNTAAVHHSEWYAEGCEHLVLHPEWRPYYPRLFELGEFLSNIDSQKIDVRARMIRGEIP